VSTSAVLIKRNNKGREDTKLDIRIFYKEVMVKSFYFRNFSGEFYVSGLTIILL